MTTKKITTLLLGAVLAVLAAVPAPADAKKVNVRIGIGDQQATMFDHSGFQALRVKRVRYFIPWNAMRNPQLRDAARAYVLAARRSNAKVFMHISSHDLRRKQGKAPSVRKYRRNVRRLVRHFRQLGVREWGVWNEANHDSQPTWNKPKRAARYFKVMHKICKGCTILPLDVLDQAGVERYIKRWYRGLKSRKWRRRAKRVGIHNYSDVNRKRTSGTRSIMRTVRRRNRRAKFWWTETGGVVNFGRSFPYDEGRAAKRLGYLFRIAKRYRRKVQRIYVYNWTGAPRGARFDAGLTNSDGSLRPGYTKLRKKIRRFKR